MMEQPVIPGFRFVPRNGVIYVMHEAMQRGFTYDSDWANLGQGSPETGDIPGAPPRIESIKITAANQQYSPIQGNFELRQAVADFYNTTYRQGKKSQYTAENVSIASGGRLALTRLAAAMNNINMGHFIPDYTAYEELLSIFKAFIPIPILLETETGYRITPSALKKEILGRGLSALLVSNPSNPTGQLIEGRELWAWCELARECRCSLIIDEFYSHYVYANGHMRSSGMVSAAEYVDDVDNDPIILVDGLTKNWRYPGWRISWTLGPRQVIEAIASAGSFLDGGANHPFQTVAIPLLNPQLAIQETMAIQQHFTMKREYILDRLQQMGIGIDVAPAGGFYVWANLSDLPEPLNDGMNFFLEGLKEQVITVPGIFFDVNPDSRRVYARFQNYSRISFGPEMKTLEAGLNAIERMIKKNR
jgi:aspartate/methionine/tyrosine aminotransferase